MKMNATFGALALACLLSGPACLAESISLAASNDTWIRTDRSHAANGVDGVLDARLDFVPYVQFDLSGLSIDTISSATLRLWKVASARNDTITTGRFATYGLPATSGNTLQNWHEIDDFDPLDATSGLDFRNVGLEYTAGVGDGIDRARVTSLDPDDGGVNVTESVDNTTGEIVVTGDDLASFLNGRVGDGGLVTFVLPVEATGRGWGIASKENLDSGLHPQLDLEFTAAVPEPGCLTLFAIFGLSAATLPRGRR